MRRIPDILHAASALSWIEPAVRVERRLNALRDRASFGRDLHDVSAIGFQLLKEGELVRIALDLQQRGFFAVFVGLQVADFQPAQVECRRVPAPLEALEAETAQTVSLDLGYADGPWEANVTLFGADIENATRLREIATDRVELVNIDGTTRVRGTELWLPFEQDGFTVTGSYVFVDASEPDPTGLSCREVPLTLRHKAGLVGMWEEHGKGRIGIEAYYTGEEQLDDSP